MGKGEKTKYKQVLLDEEAYNILNELRGGLPMNGSRPASFSKAVKHQQSMSKDIHALINENFEELYQLLLQYYSGNASKAHLAEQFRIICHKAVKSEQGYKCVSKKLLEAMEGEGER